MRVRAIIPYLQKYVPGNPSVVSEFMPGGGGRKAANYIYRSARPDGLTMGNIGGGMVLNAVLGEPGFSTISTSSTTSALPTVVWCGSF